MLLVLVTSCRTHQRVVSHTLTSHVTHITEPCHTHQRVTSHTLIVETHPCLFSIDWHQRVTSHTSTSHVTHTNESRCTYKVAALRCVAMRCSALQCVVECCSVLSHVARTRWQLYGVLPCVAVCRSAL